MIITRWAIVFVQLLSFTGASDSGIVGGKESKPHSRPYMVSLQVDGHHKCGGILIHKNFVLTAAHCKSPDLVAVLGAHDITKKEKSQQRMVVADSIVHPNFTGEYENDVMVLKLRSAAVLNKYVKTIGLPKKDGKIRARITCVVAGWGIIGANKATSSVLKEATEETQFDVECKGIWQHYFNGRQMICTKFDKKKGGVCQGDSGGPLLCNSLPQGITAYTLQDNCSHTKYPHVFMKVPFFVQWIRSAMRVSSHQLAKSKVQPIE